MYEERVDGWRIVAYKDGQRVRLVGRHGVDHARRFPDLTPAGQEAGWQAVIERGYEGYVAKDEASAYEGGATRRWLKVKQTDWTVAEDGWRWRISTT